LSFALSTTQFSKLHHLTKANANCFVCLNAVDPKDVDELSKIFHLTPDGRRYLAENMTKGQAIVKFVNGPWTHSMLCTFPPLPYNKNVSASDWTNALERINAYAPQTSPHRPPRRRPPGRSSRRRPPRRRR